MGKKTVLMILVAAMFLLPAQRASALENEDLLSLVAMPLAVAAVSEMTDVPMNQLMDIVTLLNDAQVPPTQFVEVVRYVPVALVVDDTRTDFVDFLRVQEQDGVRGTALVTSIEDRIHTYGIPSADLDIVRPRVVDVVETEFVPPVVRTRIADVRRAHPHGGPPGQLKKAAGVQTGAEIVHGSSPKRVVVDDRDRVAKRENESHEREAKHVEKAKKHVEQHVEQHVEKHGNDDRGNGGGNDKGHGGGGKGKKGKG
jgi:hypothetical protein